MTSTVALNPDGATSRSHDANTSCSVSQARPTAAPERQSNESNAGEMSDKKVTSIVMIAVGRCSGGAVGGGAAGGGSQRPQRAMLTESSVVVKGPICGAGSARVVVVR